MSVYVESGSPTVIVDSSGVAVDIGINKVLEQKISPYCNLTDVEELVHRHDLDLGFNDASDYDYWIGKAIRRAERMIDRYTQTSFHRTKRREWHDGNGDRIICLDYYPILEINEVFVYSAGFHQTFSFPSSSFVVDNDAGSIGFRPLYYTNNSLMDPAFAAVGYVFVPGTKNCGFDYTYGFDMVPDTGEYAGIRDATAMLTASLLLDEAESRQSQGLMSLNTEGQGTQYGKWGMRAQMLKKEAYEMAHRYRRQLIRGVWM
jgi:hypothetical protein